MSGTTHLPGWRLSGTQELRKATPSSHSTIQEFLSSRLVRFFRASLLLPLIGALALTARAESSTNAEPQEAPAEFKSDNPAYRPADDALNEARLHMGSVESAVERVKRLEAIAAKYPDYAYRADVLYYLGVNNQMLMRYDAAIAAFEAALMAEPDIAKETPIVSYLRTLKGRTFTRQASATLITILLASLALAFWRLARSEAAVPWGRLSVVYGLTLAFWAALVLLVPVVLGQPLTGLDPFPKPVLSDSHLGQLGDTPLRALLLYGAGAILATLPIIVAVATLTRKPARALLSGLGVLAVAGSIMGLYGLRYCYADTQYDAGSKRVFFLIKNIATKEDVPDEMLPLFDKDFRKKILESRRTTATPAKAASSNCPCVEKSQASE